MEPVVEALEEMPSYLGYRRVGEDYVVAWVYLDHVFANTSFQVSHASTSISLPCTLSEKTIASGERTSQ